MVWAFVVPLALIFLTNLGGKAKPTPMSPSPRHTEAHVSVRALVALLRVREACAFGVCALCWEGFTKVSQLSLRDVSKKGIYSCVTVGGGGGHVATCVL